MGMTFQVERITRLPDIPWGMAFITPSQIIFTQKKGKTGILNPENQTIDMLDGDFPDVDDRGQGGLLDVAVPGDYHPGGYLYFTYSKKKGSNAVTTLARAKVHQNRIIDWQDLVISKSESAKHIHFGSRIAFDNHGHVFFTVGDRGVRSNAQDLTNHAGTILRVNPDGTIPENNPFFNDPAALPEIYSYGHRNPQGIVYDSRTDRLWAIEHGPRGGDEINRIFPGKNYGWPVISYGKEYWGPVQVGEGTRKKGMIQPVKHYTPSIAPGSLLLYTGNAFPKWKGSLFAGALKLEHLNRIELDKEGNFMAEERLLESLQARIRALAQSPEGWIYFSTDDGDIFRIIPAG